MEALHSVIRASAVRVPGYYCWYCCYYYYYIWEKRSFLTLVQAHQPENLRRGKRPSGSSFLGENCVVALTRHPLLCYFVFWSFILVVFASYFAFLCSLQRGIAKKKKETDEGGLQGKVSKNSFQHSPFFKSEKGDFVFFFRLWMPSFFWKQPAFVKCVESCYSSSLLFMWASKTKSLQKHTHTHTHTHTKKVAKRSLIIYIYI